MPYVIEFPVVTSLEQGMEFERAWLSLTVNGSFSHIPKVGEKKETIVQPFSVIVTCGKQRKTTVTWVLHMNPETEQQQREREEQDRMVREDGFAI